MSVGHDSEIWALPASELCTGRRLVRRGGELSGDGGNNGANGVGGDSELVRRGESNGESWETPCKASTG